MPGKFLIASADVGTREVVRRAFAKFGAEAEVCDGAAEAFAHLNQRWDGVVLDCEDVELAVQLLTGIRQRTENQGHPALIALLPSHTPVQQVLAAGATVALHKPLRPDQLAVSLRVSLRLTTANEKAAAAKEEGRAVTQPSQSRK